MSQTTANTLATFHLADGDKWDTYIKQRPGYPDSMFQRWLDYHGKDNKLESIYDLGTGGGVGAMALLKALPRLHRHDPANSSLKTLHLSDPGEANIAAARHNLTPTRFPGINFTFHRGPGEEPNPNIAPGTLDMVMACECLHWTRIEPTMRNIAASLRPGGTFAAILYNATPRIIGDGDGDGNPAARQAQLAVERLWQRTLDARGAQTDVRARLQCANGLDFVPMDPAVWERGSVVRWYCAVRNREWAFEELLLGLAEEEIAAGRPRVWADFGPGREVEEVVEQDLVDWGRRGVGVAELRAWQAARRPGAFDDVFETGEWKLLERAVEEGGGRCDVEIPALMILGKKKK
ncbi:unnamed protein product [Discula destructiva]